MKRQRMRKGLERQSNCSGRPPASPPKKGWLTKLVGQEAVRRNNVARVYARQKIGRLSRCQAGEQP